MNDDNFSSVPAVDRALNILEFLTERQDATIKTLSDELDIPFASASRLVKVLTNRGYLEEQEGISSRYSLGFKLLYYSQIKYQQLDLGKVAVEHMKKLSAVTNQTSQIAILEKNNVVYTEQVLPQTPVSIIAPLRTPLSVNVSASGKVLFAWMPEEDQLARLSEASLAKMTERSIVDKVLLLKELKAIKKQGYALDTEEYSLGIGCIAAPIFDHAGKNVAAVGITGRIMEYRDKRSFKIIKECVLDAARNISKDIGFSG